MFYFWKKDVENNYFLVSPEYYLKQAYQKLVFRLNQKFYRDQTQTVFSNVSIFDRVYLEELFGGREYPDGTFVIDYIEEIMDAQKLFMEVISETRRTQLFTYPVLTYSLILVVNGLVEAGLNVNTETTKPNLTIKNNKSITESAIAKMFLIGTINLVVSIASAGSK